MGESRQGRQNNSLKKQPIPVKYIVAFGIFCIVVIAAVTIGAVLSNRQSGGEKGPALETVATINGYPVTVREVETRLTDGRGYIRNYFEKEYQVTKEDASFWDTKFDDVTPMEYGRDYYYEESLRIKMVQILGKEMGLVDDISYESFLARLEEENARRSAAVANSEPIYGLLQYTEFDFFDAEFSSLEEKVFEKLVEDGKLPVSEDEMRTYYDENRERRFKNADDYTFEVVTAVISPSSEDGEDAEALAAIQAFEERLQAGESFEELTKKVQDGEFEGLTYTVVEVSEDTDALDLEKVAALQQAAKDLEQNEVSSILTSKFYYYSIGRYTSFQDNGYAEFDSDAVKNNITYALQQQKYEQYITDQIKEADVRRNDEVYATIVLPENYR